eukprot:438593-Rhodomonas_salina.2
MRRQTANTRGITAESAARATETVPAGPTALVRRRSKLGLFRVTVETFRVGLIVSGTRGTPFPGKAYAAAHSRTHFL